jgi:hypothetical protein
MVLADALIFYKMPYIYSQHIKTMKFETDLQFLSRKKTAAFSNSIGLYDYTWMAVAGCHEIWSIVVLRIGSTLAIILLGSNFLFFSQKSFLQ